MRLLQIQANGSFSLVIHEDTSRPPYAILSHTWSENNEDEVSYDDLRNETGREKSGYAKLKFCAEQAAKDGLEHFWVDTCCIDRSSSLELSEAITSMFRWYMNSAQCYVYLADVTTKRRKGGRESPDHETSNVTWMSAFRNSRWFTRGWTLQELLAPRVVLFFSRDGNLLGDKFSLEQHIHEVTHIPIPALRGAPLHSFSVDDRMSWAASRSTRREEDRAYSLLGIFGVSMMAIYGEQETAAFRRLRKGIIDAVQDRALSSDDGKRQALMESLRFDQIEARYATIKNAHAKTCKWLLRKSEHTEWLDPTRLSDHHGFLWIKGKPGTGKSTLMKFAFSQASKSRKSSIVIAFFFNTRGETLEKTVIGMYRSLLLQLLEKVPTLQCNPGSLSLASSNISADHQWTRHSLEDQLQQAVLSLGEMPVTCFIDALNECEQWQVRSMISFFEHLGELAVSSGRSFRVCLSSRHYPEITIRRGIGLVLEEQEGHAQDINNYLESVLRIGTSASAQKIRKDLQEKSYGVFTWIALVVDVLNEEYDGGRMYALERKLKQIPADLHDLFLDTLTRDSNDKEELILCLQWVLFAKQPLQPEQLYFAILAGIVPDELATEHHQEVTLETIRKFLLSSSKGLTEITKTKNKSVQFIHESVRDFLLKQNGLSKIWPEFANNFQGQSHERLKQCCRNYISMDIATALKLPDKLPEASLPESADLRRSAAQLFPFLEYAVRNVLYHADTAEREGISQVDFLNNFPLARWIMLDNLFEKHQVRRHTKHVSLLYLLAELNLASLIKALGSAHCCMDVENERYGCPLFAAAATSSEQALEVCVESIDLQQTHSNLVVAGDERSFLHRSIQYSARRGFVYMKSKGFLLNAAELGHDRLLALLITSGRFENVSQDSNDTNLLWWASKNGCEISAKLLIALEPAMIDGKDKNERTPLIVAAEHGHTEVTELLLEEGADLEATSKIGNALYVASAKGNEEVVALLLDKGADVDAQGGLYETALQAASRFGHREIVALLLDNGANINAQGGAYGTALKVASAEGHRDVAELLLDRGAEDYTQAEKHGNAFRVASITGSKEVDATQTSNIPVPKSPSQLPHSYASNISSVAASVAPIVFDNSERFTVSSATTATNLFASGTSNAAYDKTHSYKEAGSRVPSSPLERPKAQTEANSPNMQYLVDDNPMDLDEDCVSVVSDNQSIGSRADGYERTPRELFAVRKIGDFLGNLDDLRDLQKRALRVFGKERFVRNYRRLLKGHLLRLRTQITARTRIEDATLRILRSNINRVNIAENVAKALDPEEEEKPKLHDVLQYGPNEKESVVDWMDSAETEVPVTREEDESDDGIDDSEGEEEAVVNSIEAVSNSIESEEESDFRISSVISDAYDFLKRDLTQFDLDLRMLLLPVSIRDVLETVPRDDVRISHTDDMSFINKLKAFIEDNTAIEWDWWPLTPRLRHLEPGRRRLEWKVGILLCVLLVVY
jgi:ankyrin repeat protein